MTNEDGEQVTGGGRGAVGSPLEQVPETRPRGALTTERAACVEPGQAAQGESGGAR